MKRTIILLIVILLGTGITGCNNNEIKEENEKEKSNEVSCEVNPEDDEMKSILNQFDLTEEKIIWNGTTSDEYSDDCVIIFLKKTYTYPELELKHFGIETAISIRYISDVNPPDYFFEKEYKQQLKAFRQIISMKVKPEGKENILKIIKDLEKLKFVQKVTPNLYYGEAI